MNDVEEKNERAEYLDKFIIFVIDELTKDIDTDLYYTNYDNMDCYSLYCYLKGKFDAKREKGE